MEQRLCLDVCFSAPDLFDVPFIHFAWCILTAAQYVRNSMLLSGDGPGVVIVILLKKKTMVLCFLGYFVM